MRRRSILTAMVVALLCAAPTPAWANDPGMDPLPSERGTADTVRSRRGKPFPTREFSFSHAPAAPAPSTGYGPVCEEAMYLEIAGQSAGITLNFEHKYFKSQPHNLALRLGIGGFLFRLCVPVSLSYLLGHDHMLEIGTGGLYVTGETVDLFSGKTQGTYSDLYVTGFAGYRYEQERGGFLFRAGVTPLILLSTTSKVDDHFSLSAGLSFGYAFL